MNIKITFICWALLMSSEVWAQDVEPISWTGTQCSGVPSGRINSPPNENAESSTGQVDRDLVDVDAWETDPVILGPLRADVFFDENCEHMMVIRDSDNLWAAEGNFMGFIFTYFIPILNLLSEEDRIVKPEHCDLANYHEFSDDEFELLYDEDDLLDDKLDLIDDLGISSCQIFDLEPTAVGSSMDDDLEAWGNDDGGMIIGQSTLDGDHIIFTIKGIPGSDEFFYEEVSHRIDGRVGFYKDLKGEGDGAPRTSTEVSPVGI